MILKMHTADGDSMFIDIGREYTVVKRDFPNFETRLVGAIGEGDPAAYKKVFAFLLYNGGINSLPLWEGVPYYVYTEGGRLFDTLTFR